MTDDLTYRGKCQFCGYDNFTIAMGGRAAVQVKICKKCQQPFDIRSLNASQDQELADSYDDVGGYENMQQDDY